jgi:transposase
MAAWPPADVVAALSALQQENEQLRHQLEWFKRQLFGSKSERFVPEANPQQLHLGESLPTAEAASSAQQAVSAHTRKTPQRDFAQDDAAALPFFDASKVPVETIAVANPEVEGLTPDQYEVIGEKITFKLAQRPGSYVVLKYVRPQVKRLDTQALHCPPAPAGVLDHSRADVSFLAGLLVDKFAYHLPLYRQHLRLTDSGITVSRPWLTQLVQQGIGLLLPIDAAQLDSIRSGRVIAMDETPIKAGHAGPGKMKAAYFWPVYGELDEVCFPFFESRRHEHVQQVLGLQRADGAVLLTDGYAAYTAYAQKLGLTHAQCWVHCRRAFFEAQGVEPEPVQQALTMIGALYDIEEDIRQRQLSGPGKQAHRMKYSKPIVDQFFAWVDQQLRSQAFLPSSPLTKALAYARERRNALEVFLSDPGVPMDTNHLERSLRPIPMGKKNWMFCWTEAGAKNVGVIQGLIVTCRLHGIDPYTYLVDVLQRVQTHPAKRVQELTPRLWKQHFADNPLRSDVHKLTA